MVDPRSRADDESAEDAPAGATDEEPSAGAGDGDPTDRNADPTGTSTEELRRQVEEKYDFDDFGPEDMAEMTAEEWDAVFDAETWITGADLLDRVEADLKSRVLDRDVFARVERLANPDRVVAYSDEGYAVVHGDGSVEGRGTVLRDVKPSVALCSMESYDVPDAPDGELLPEPMDVPEGSGEFGNLMLQVVAGAQLLAGVGLLGSVLVVDYGRASIIAVTAGLGFLVIGLFLFLMVANARLSDKFRAEEYRNRLRAVGLEDGERPEFLPESARERPGLGESDPEPEGAESGGGTDT